MTELEAAIRSALRERADEVTAESLRRPTLRPQPSSRGRWYAALATAALVAVLAAVLAIVAGHDSTRSESASPAAGIAGYRWDLTSVSVGRTTYPVRPGGRTVAYLVFRPDGTIEGDDSVNYSGGGRYRLTAHGYRISGDVYTTAVGFIGKDPTRLAAQAGVEAALDTSDEIAARRVGDTLTVHAGRYTLTLHRGATVGDAAPPSSTLTR